MFRPLLSPRILRSTFLYWIVLTSLWIFVSLDRPTNVGNVFSNLVSFLSIFTGFIASFYFFVVSRSTEFLSKIQGTQTFSSILKLCSGSIILSMFVIACIYFLSALAPSFRVDGGVLSWLQNLVVTLVFLFSGLTMANFVRAVKLFVSLVD